jgi:hypothetical protein
LLTPPSCPNIYPKLGWVGKKIQKIILDKLRASVGMPDGRHNRRADDHPIRCLSHGHHPPVFSRQPVQSHTVSGPDYWAAIRRLLIVVAFAGCGGDPGERLQSGRVLALSGLQGRWVGPVLPTGSACGSPAQGLMTIGDNGFGFDPFQSTTVIQGDVWKDGRLSGSLARQGSDHRNLSITFEGAASGSETISGTLQSGRCHWSVTLHRG